jgi:Domain of unknown function (DUF4157)
MCAAMTKIIPTDLLFWAAGFTPCQTLMFVQKKHAANNALIQHELTHVRQMQRIGTLQWWAGYLFRPRFRQAVEVEAYKVQISYGMLIAEAAQYLSTMYHLGITTEEAAVLLAA